MPKTMQSVRRLREQAAKAVAALEKAIATQEKELAMLKETAVTYVKGASNGGYSQTGAVFLR